jgi:NADP-dependent 3-hydroxy acid dehydrogenase YdfG
MALGNRPQVVVVTGASAGVGRATACAFARQGAHLGLLARGRAGLAAACRDVEAQGGMALALPTEVAEADHVEAAAAAVERRFGPIDVWVNNAMCSVFSPVKDMTPADYKRVTEVTYLGVVHGTLAALRRMLARDRGMIVQVGSALAYRSIPLQSAYCAAKHAIAGFSDSLRCELLHDLSNVKVTMVQMPALNTPQFDWLAPQAATRAADLSTRGCRTGHRACGATLPAGMVRRRFHLSCDRRQQGRSAVWRPLLGRALATSLSTSAAAPKSTLMLCSAAPRGRRGAGICWKGMSGRRLK